MNFRSYLFQFLAIVSSLGIASPATADGGQVGIADLQRGVLDVKVEPYTCPPHGFQLPPSTINYLPPIGGVFVPALLQAGFETAGNALITASGQNDTQQTIEGIKPDYFYCSISVPNPEYDPDKPTNGPEYITKHYPLINRITLSTPALNKLPSHRFEIDIELRPSEDGTAFRLLPTRINYPSPIFNSRAYGALVEVGLIGLGGSTSRIVLPLAKVSCGRTYHICTRETLNTGITRAYVTKFDKVGSGWISIPATSDPSTQTIEKIGRKTPYKSAPVTITAKLLEVSDYDKLMAFLGNLLVTNKKDLSNAVITSLPPIGPSGQAERLKAETDVLVGRAEYLAESTEYEKARASGAECSMQFKTWKAAVVAAAKGRLETSLLQHPPPCSLK